MIQVNFNKVLVKYFPDNTQKLNVDVLSNNNCITWKYENDEELSTLIFITKHIKSVTDKNAKLTLILDYIPNARFDRVKSNNEVFTLKWFCDVVNWLEFDKVLVLDPHSHVSESLINNIVIQDELLKKYIKYTIDDIARKENNNIVIVFPDASAAKRYSEKIDNLPYMYANKIRDWKTGQILRTEIVKNGIDCCDSTILMIDDIIAYGGSMKYVSDELIKNKCGNIYAYATHVENNILNEEKGILLKSKNVKHVYTTDSLYNKKSDWVTVLK